MLLHVVMKLIEFCSQVLSASLTPFDEDLYASNLVDIPILNRHGVSRMSSANSSHSMLTSPLPRPKMTTFRSSTLANS
jgi:hypothetical protein